MLSEKDLVVTLLPCGNNRTEEGASELSFMGHNYLRSSHSVASTNSSQKQSFDKESS
jgi:hypothetical protein